MGSRLTYKEEARTANTGFASGGVTCKLGALCFYLSSVLVDSFVLRNPPELKDIIVVRSALFTSKCIPYTL